MPSTIHIDCQYIIFSRNWLCCSTFNNFSRMVLEDPIPAAEYFPSWGLPSWGNGQERVVLLPPLLGSWVKRFVPLLPPLCSLTLEEEQRLLLIHSSNPSLGKAQGVFQYHSTPPRDHPSLVKVWRAKEKEWLQAECLSAPSPRKISFS